MQCTVYDSALGGLSESYLGSFTIDLTKYAITTKIYFIRRLTRLLKYLKQKNERRDIWKPLEIILRQMAEYLVEENELNFSMTPQVAMQTNQFQSRVAEATNFLVKSQILAAKSQDLIKTSEEPADIIEQKKEHQSLLQISMIALKDKEPLEKKQKVVVFPKYEMKKDNYDLDKEIKEGKIPEDYIELGFDSLKTTIGNKHYRLALKTPLESTPYVSQGVFDRAPIFRGKKIASDKMWLSSLFFKEEPYKEVGLFRGEVKLIEERYIQDIMNLGLPAELKKLQLPASVYEWEYSSIDSNVINERKVKINVYVVDAQIFTEVDIGSAADPYVVLKIGNKQVSVVKGS